MDPVGGAVLVLVVVALAEFLRRGSWALESDRPYLAEDEPIVVKGLCSEISLVYEPLLARGVDEGIPTGDLEFDRHVHLDGPEALVRALFDVSARSQTLELLSGEVSLKDLVLNDRELSTDPRGLGPKRRALIAERVHALGQCLERPTDIARRLADALEKETAPAARRLQLRTLIAEYPRHPATLWAVAQAAKDEDPEMRLEAGITLGAEGRTLLLALAGDDQIEDAVSARAIEGLGPHLSAADAASLLAAALGSARRHGVLQPFKRSETARACVAALAQSGGPAAEDAVVGALASAEHDVRIHAAAVLGRMGSVAAVEALQAAAERHGGALRRVVRNAVVQIQSRVNATHGDVALAAPDAGHVSLAADDAAGRVSLETPRAREKPSAD